MTKALWTASALQAATQGMLLGEWNWECFGVSIDSRQVTEGDLFVAIKGPSFDGHKFVKAALEAGAKGALVSEMPDDCSEADNLLLVADTVVGLEDIARASRKRTDAKIIAVTGSVGKTGVKEAIGQVLAHQGKTHVTQGNLNNHFGLPLTLARMAQDCDFAVLEMGMNHAGEIAPLSKMAQPHVAVITTIAAAHLENFANMEGICDAKCEIFEGLSDGGTAILNADSEFYQRMVSKLGEHVHCAFGYADTADAKAISADPSPQGGSDIYAEIAGDPIDYRITHDGTHWVNNSLCVLAAVKAAGADMIKASETLGQLGQLKGRGAVHSVAIQGGALRIIDESYNANEASMRAALDVLAHKQGRKIAVLGDMLELGPDEVAIHQSLVDALGPIDLVFCCGPLMKNLFDALPAAKQGGYGETSQDIVQLVLATVQAGDCISIKSSRGTRTDLVLDALLALHPSPHAKEET